MDSRTGAPGKGTGRFLILIALALGARIGMAEVPGADLSAIPAAVDRVIRANIFDPAVLDTPAYARITAEASTLPGSTSTAGDFANAYNRLWLKDGPVSHVRMTAAQGNATQMATFLDGMDAGPSAFAFEWKGDIAILTINSMMGADTVDSVHAAFREITERKARGLIVDLRANEGGAFAGVALASHLIDKPYDAGAFYSRSWVTEGKAQPGRADTAGLDPWTGWSIVSFWRDVASAPATRIQFQPAPPHYGGPTFVLTSKATASAAEMTADALAGSGRATLIGETTAGQMLSQKPFDLPGGLQVFLPIANYVSWHSGQIEGKGVVPDIASPAKDAMATALQRLGRPRPERRREDDPLGDRP